MTFGGSVVKKMCRKNRILEIAAILLALRLATGVATAQSSTASISGTVLDSSGAVVANAAVDAVSLETGSQRSVRTSSGGVYSLTALGIGTYRVSVTAPGFQSYTWQSVQLQVGQNRTLDAKLTLASVGTQVEVEDTAPLDLTSASVGGVVSGTQIRELPVNGRSWATLMTLTPGAIDSGTGTQRSIRFVGRGLDDNNFRFDGVDATGIFNQNEKASIRLEFSTEAIAEFRSNAAVYTAESGGTQGGQVDVVSKSGTNQFHGSTFEYLRNSYFDARGPFDTSLPPFRLNQFGGSLGGPIRKDKDFFFVTYEGLRQRIATTLIGFVPSAAYRASLPANSPLQFVLSAYPVGNSRTSDPSVDRYTGSAKQLDNEDFGLFRYDHKFSDSNTLSIRYNIDNGVQNNPNGSLRDTQAVSLATHNAAITLNTILTPQTINVFKVGFNRSNYVVQNSSVLNQAFIVSPFSTLNDNTGQIQASNSFDWLDTITTVKGRHTLEAGFEIRRLQANSTATSANDYQFTYPSATAFLANQLQQASLVNTVPITGLRRTEYFGFVQDAWRITPNFTANLGLRYEYFGVPYEVKDRGVVFDPLSCPGGYCGKGAAYYFPDYNNVSPRVSIAWSPAGTHDKTVIRSGYGIFYGDGQIGDLNAPTDNTSQRNLITSGAFPNLTYPLTPAVLGSTSFVANPRGLDRHRRTPSTQEWTFSVQQALTSKTVLTTSYLGSKGTDQFTRTYINTANPITHQVAYPQFGIIDYKSTHSNSTFEALQTQLQRNLNTDLVASANYMWSHSINDGAVGGGEAIYPQNVNCRACEKASSDQDVRHYLSGSLVYALPFGPGKRFLNTRNFAGAVLGGWHWSNILYARSGLPVNVSIARSASALPDLNTLSPHRPNVVPGVSLVPANQTIYSWINASAFSTPAGGTFGNAGRNLVRGPAEWQLDTALEKHIPIFERLNLSFRAEAFNVFNHTHYGVPNAVFSSSSSFGTITTEQNATGIGTGTPRELEFALRLEF